MRIERQRHRTILTRGRAAIKPGSAAVRSVGTGRPVGLKLGALVIGLAPILTTASLLILPYLAWVSFAAWLDYMIVRLNGPFPAA